jgi:hypothetical protein
MGRLGFLVEYLLRWNGLLSLVVAVVAELAARLGVLAVVPVVFALRGVRVRLLNQLEIHSR